MLNSRARFPRRVSARAVNHGATVNGSRILSPRGTDLRAREASHQPRITLVGALRVLLRAHRRGARNLGLGRKDETPEACALGVPLTGPRHEVRNERKNGSAFGAVHEPVRSALRGTGSLGSHRPKIAKTCESRQLGDTSWDGLSDSQRPATNAGHLSRSQAVCLTDCRPSQDALPPQPDRARLGRAAPATPRTSRAACAGPRLGHVACQ